MSSTQPPPSSYNTKIIWNKKHTFAEGLEIEIGLRDDMMRSIRERIITNLNATKRFLQLQEKDYDDICAGIYTYAVEEYGKILYLRNLQPSHPTSNRVTIGYTHHNGDFRDHNNKFDFALKDTALPNSCKVLKAGDFDWRDFEKEDFIVDTIADMESRMAVFYSDFDKKNNYNSISQPLKVDRKLLEKAVDDFLNFMNGLKI